MTSQHTAPAPWIVVAKILAAGRGVAVVLPSLGDAVVLGVLPVRWVIPLAALEQPVENATFWTALVVQVVAVLASVVVPVLVLSAAVLVVLAVLLAAVVLA
ncbi:hypothetical protein GN244_ATG09591 [Phytophthora infestans]|uniref:Transmembrane protein n=1 Tax=Phytophthora infestans TaxID=4787 RepID=A0A833SUF5_PHYIN|nr:hypothetical protein GN244_ATG09591 [Phytophthora infestans]